MTPTEADIAPFLIAEHPALDLLNSRCAPWGEEIEWLGDGGALLAWLQAAGLITAQDAHGFIGQEPQLELDTVATQARQLREQFRAIIDQVAGAPFPAALFHLCTPLNQLLADDIQRQELKVSPQEQLLLAGQRRYTNPSQLLLPLAQAMAELITSPELLRVKQCQGQGCTLWYLDNSKNQRRRWCSMSVCGNRAKAAAHRARKQ